MFCMEKDENRLLQKRNSLFLSFIRNNLTLYEEFFIYLEIKFLIVEQNAAKSVLLSDLY